LLRVALRHIYPPQQSNLSELKALILVQNVFDNFIILPCIAVPGNAADVKTGGSRHQTASGVTQQGVHWAETHKVQTATFENGIPVPSLTASLGIGQRGDLTKDWNNSL